MPAKSEAQRRYLYAHFGPQWVDAHHFNNKGALPEHVQHMAQGGVAANPRTMSRAAHMYKSRIHINPAHKGEFTAKAKRAGMGVQAYASRVLGASKGTYPTSTRKQANFAHNFAH